MFLGVSLKMYFDHRQTVSWAEEIVARSASAARRGVEVVLVPSFPSLEAVARIGGAHGVKLGAQDLYWEAAGPYTGEVSGASLAQVGCEYVEVGHAERRLYFGEDDEAVARKVGAALRSGIAPILCVGEEERGAPDDAADACVHQLEAAVAAVGPSLWGRPMVVAYEPVWAIGQAEPASAGHVRRVATALRDWLARRWGEVARVAYGGSAGVGLLAEIEEAVDGLFLGRYAHDPDVFSAILDEAEKVAARRA